MCRCCTRNNAPWTHTHTHTHTLPCKPPRRMSIGCPNWQVTTTAGVLWGGLGAQGSHHSPAPQAHRPCAACRQSAVQAVQGILTRLGPRARGIRAGATHVERPTVTGLPLAPAPLLAAMVKAGHGWGGGGSEFATTDRLCSITQTASDATFSSLAPSLCDPTRRRALRLAGRCPAQPRQQPG